VSIQPTGLGGEEKGRVYHQLKKVPQYWHKVLANSQKERKVGGEERGGLKRGEESKT